MELRTKIDSHEYNFNISHDDTCLMLGSCFTENIGGALQQFKIDTFVNPNGIVFDPHSIARFLHRVIENAPYHAEDLFFYNEQWHSWDHHSRFSSTDKNELIEFINIQFSSFRAALKDAKALFITFGTAWYFELKENRQKVANCHKIPAIQFDRKIADYIDLFGVYSNLVAKLKTFNPSLNIITTVSPVRHIKNGLSDDQHSKSLLRTLCGELPVEYFPSYEMLVDDLRDYRFYKEDLIHPSQLAQKYVWGIFSKQFFSENTIQLNEVITKIHKTLMHRPINPKSPEHITSLRKSITQVETIQHQLPHLNFSKEINEFKHKLELALAQ